MDWAMARPAFKTQLFRFVDVFPALTQRRRRRPAPRRVLRRGRRAQGPRPGHRRGRPRAVRRAASRPGWPAATSCAWREQFIVGATPEDAVGRPAPAVARGQRVHRRPARREDGRGRRGRPLRRPGRRAADGARPTPAPGWAPDDHLERDDLGPLPRVNVSVKPTALATHYEPLTRRGGLAGAKERLRPDPAAGPRAGRVRQRRHGARRRQGPHARSCSASCCPRTSSPTCPPASWSRPTCATAATTWPT